MSIEYGSDDRQAPKGRRQRRHSVTGQSYTADTKKNDFASSMSKARTSRRSSLVEGNLYRKESMPSKNIKSPRNGAPRRRLSMTNSSKVVPIVRSSPMTRRISLSTGNIPTNKCSAQEQLCSKSELNLSNNKCLDQTMHSNEMSTLNCEAQPEDRQPAAAGKGRRRRSSLGTSSVGNSSCSGSEDRQPVVGRRGRIRRSSLSTGDIGTSTYSGEDQLGSRSELDLAMKQPKRRSSIVSPGSHEAKNGDFCTNTPRQRRLSMTSSFMGRSRSSSPSQNETNGTGDHSRCWDKCNASAALPMRQPRRRSSMASTVGSKGEPKNNGTDSIAAPSHRSTSGRRSSIGNSPGSLKKKSLRRSSVSSSGSNENNRTSCAPHRPRIQNDVKNLTSMDITRNDMLMLAQDNQHGEFDSKDDKSANASEVDHRSDRWRRDPTQVDLGYESIESEEKPMLDSAPPAKEDQGSRRCRRSSSEGDLPSNNTISSTQIQLDYNYDNKNESISANTRRIENKINRKESQEISRQRSFIKDKAIYNDSLSSNGEKLKAFRRNNRSMDNNRSADSPKRRAQMPTRTRSSSEVLRIAATAVPSQSQHTNRSTEPFQRGVRRFMSSDGTRRTTKGDGQKSFNGGSLTTFLNGDAPSVKGESISDQSSLSLSDVSTALSSLNSTASPYYKIDAAEVVDDDPCKNKTDGDGLSSQQATLGKSAKQGFSLGESLCKLNYDYEKEQGGSCCNTSVSADGSVTLPSLATINSADDISFMSGGSCSVFSSAESSEHHAAPPKKFPKPALRRSSIPSTIEEESRDHPQQGSKPKRIPSRWRTGTLSEEPKPMIRMPVPARRRPEASNRLSVEVTSVR